MACQELNEKQTLERAKTEIEFSNLAHAKADKIGVETDCVLNPSKDWHKLKSYARVSY